MLIRKGQNLPQALQILFPASSRLHSGVALVPQFAQLNAPTGARPLPPRTTPFPFPPSEVESAAAGVMTGTAAAAGSEAAAAASLAACERRLLYVGQPAQAEVPPVPSQRPSPGQVPAACFSSARGDAAGVGIEGGEETSVEGCCWCSALVAVGLGVRPRWGGRAVRRAFK